MERRIVVLNLRSKSTSEPKRRFSVLDWFQKNVTYILTLAGLLAGLYQFTLSQILSDIRKFEQTYFDEKLTIYKNISRAMSEILVDMQLKSDDSLRVDYKTFKTSYWRIQLVSDRRNPTYAQLLQTLKDFDQQVDDYLLDRPHATDTNDAVEFEAILVINDSISSNLNKLILNERERIKSHDYYSGYLSSLWF